MLTEPHVPSALYESLRRGFFIISPNPAISLVRKSVVHRYMKQMEAENRRQETA